MHSVKDKQRSVVSSFDYIVNVAEERYSKLHSLHIIRTTLSKIKVDQDTEVPDVTIDEVRRALQGMSCRKATKAGSVTVHLIKDGGDFIFRKLAILHPQCLKISNVPVSCKSINIILIHQKKDVKDLVWITAT